MLLAVLDYTRVMYSLFSVTKYLRFNFISRSKIYHEILRNTQSSSHGFLGIISQFVGSGCQLFTKFQIQCWGFLGISGNS